MRGPLFLFFQIVKAGRSLPCETIDCLFGLLCFWSVQIQLINNMRRFLVIVVLLGGKSKGRWIAVKITFSLAHTKQLQESKWVVKFVLQFFISDCAGWKRFRGTQHQINKLLAKNGVIGRVALKNYSFLRFVASLKLNKSVKSIRVRANNISFEGNYRQKPVVVVFNRISPEHA